MIFFYYDYYQSIESESVSHLVMSNSLWSHRLQPFRLLFHEILQVRILEWVAIPFSRGSSRPGCWTWVSRVAGRLFTIWATREAHTVLKPCKYPPLLKGNPQGYISSTEAGVKLSRGWLFCFIVGFGWSHLEAHTVTPEGPVGVLSALLSSPLAVLSVI